MISFCRNQASKYRFRDKIDSDERLIEQLIVGTKHKKIQERLLEKGEQLTFVATGTTWERKEGHKRHKRKRKQTQQRQETDENEMQQLQSRTSPETPR